jgi:hypothetical protein
MARKALITGINGIRQIAEGVFLADIALVQGGK